MKELICIVCPNGCALTISGEGKAIQVTGNRCPRGKAFAIAEETNPTRTICSTVKTAFAQVPVLPVRVSSEIPKNRIFDVMKEINKVVVTEPIGCGDVVIQNVLDLGVDIIATSNILKAESKSFLQSKKAGKWREANHAHNCTTEHPPTQADHQTGP